VPVDAAHPLNNQLDIWQHFVTPTSSLAAPTASIVLLQGARAQAYNMQCQSVILFLFVNSKNGRED